MDSNPTIPPPTKNLILPTPKTSELTTVGMVLSVDDGRATVDVGGSSFNLSIPGDVIGVKAGKSVAIRVRGNARTITNMVSPLTPPTYTGATAVRRGATVAPPTISTNDPTNAFADDIGGLDLGSITGEIRSALQAVSNRYANINNNFDSIVGAYTDMRGRYITTRNQLNDLQTTVAQMREKQETLIDDLRTEFGLIK